MLAYIGGDLKQRPPLKVKEKKISRYKKNRTKTSRCSFIAPSSLDEDEAKPGGGTAEETLAARLARPHGGATSRRRGRAVAADETANVKSTYDEPAEVTSYNTSGIRICDRGLPNMLL